MNERSLQSQALHLIPIYLLPFFSPQQFCFSLSFVWLSIIFNLFPLFDFIYELFSLFGSSSWFGFVFFSNCGSIRFSLVSDPFFSPYFSLAFCIYRLSAFAWNARPILRFLNAKRLVLFTQPFQKRFLKEHVLFKLLYLKNISQITNIKNPKTKWHEEMKRVKHHNLQISVKDWLCLRGAINECSKESNWNCIYIYLYLYVRCTKPIQTRTNNSKQKRKIKKNQQQQRPKQSFKIST